MEDRLAARLAALRKEHHQTQQQLAHVEQQRQGLLQALIGVQYAIQVLQTMLEEAACADKEGVTPYVPVAS